MAERYSMSIQGPFDCTPPELEPDNDGDWVSYSDYATLAKRLEELPSQALWDESRKALAETRNENGALRAELEAVKAELSRCENAHLPQATTDAILSGQRSMQAAFEQKARAEAAEARVAQLEAENGRLRAGLRSHWHGVHLDGRNEHGSHVLMLPHRSIELEQDSNGDFLKPYAEDILSAAEAMGFEVGDAVVATFDLCLDEGFFSHYEFVGVSTDLTTAIYGTPAEQTAARAALTGREG